MKPKLKKYKNGFTLVEMIIYIGLLSLIIASVSGVTFQIIEASNQVNNKILIEEEANFLLRKIEWALWGASEINSPPPGDSGTTLSIDKYGFLENPIVFSLNSENLEIQRGSGTSTILNSEPIKVESINFEHIASSGNSPPGIKTSLTLKKEKENPRSYEITIYVRE